MFGWVRRHVAAAGVDMSCFQVWLAKLCKIREDERGRGCQGRGPIFLMVRRGRGSVSRVSSSSPRIRKRGGSLVDRQAWHG